MFVLCIFCVLRPCCIVILHKKKLIDWLEFSWYEASADWVRQMGFSQSCDHRYTCILVDLHVCDTCDPFAVIFLAQQTELTLAPLIFYGTGLICFALHCSPHCMITNHIFFIPLKFAGVVNLEDSHIIWQTQTTEDSF